MTCLMLITMLINFLKEKVLQKELEVAFLIQLVMLYMKEGVFYQQVKSLRVINELLYFTMNS